MFSPPLPAARRPWMSLAAGRRTRARALAGLALGLCVSLVGQADAQTGFSAGVSKFHTASWGTNPTPVGGRSGLVWDVVVHEDVLYMGGEFTSIAPTIQLAGAIDGSSGLPLPGFPKLDNGQILTTASDGEGGWFVGGSFNSINGVGRNGIARIRHDGTIDENWSAPLAGVSNQASGSFTVTALARMGPYLYMGGEFTRFAEKRDPSTGQQISRGADRLHISRVGVATGTLDGGWNPGTDGPVGAIAASPDGSRVYLAGSFNTVGGAAHGGVAAVNQNGAVEGWAPPVGSVTALAVAPDSGRVYLGSSNAIHAVDTAGNPAWTALSANGPVKSLALSSNGAYLYAGGNFSNLGGQPRPRLAAVDTATGAVDAAWNPDADKEVTALSMSEDGTKVYVGGDFTTVRGAARNRLAALDAATGTVESWDPNASGRVHALAVSGSSVYAGGEFENIGSRPVTMLASVNFRNGGPEGWAPVIRNSNADGSPSDTPPTVQAMAISADGQRIFLGGIFSHIKGPNGVEVARNNLAAVDLVGNVDTTFNPGTFQGAIRSMTVWDNLTPGTSDDLLYVGGDFDSIRVSGSEQNEPGRVDVPCPAGEPDCSTPSSSGGKPSNSALWKRPGLVAALNPTTGVLDLSFDQIPASTGPGLIGQSGKTCSGGTDTCGHGAAKAIVISADGRYLYSGGTFSDQDNQLGLISLNRADGSPTAWQPELEIPVFDLDLFKGDGKSLFTAGGGAGGRIQRFLPHEGPRTPTWSHTFDGDSVGVDSSHSTVYSAGHYDFVDGGVYKRKHASAFNVNGDIAVNFDPELDTSTGPYTVEVVEGKAVIYGGEFSRVNRRPQPGLAIFSGTP